MRFLAVTGLANLRPPSTSVIPHLARVASGDADYKNRVAALEGISKISPKSPDTITTMRRALADRESLVRGAAARALGAAGAAAAEAVSDLARMVLNEPDGSMRSDAVRALGEIGAAARPAVPAILAALKSPDSFTRSTAAQALSVIIPNDVNAANDLVVALNDSDKYVRHWSIRALSAMGPAARSAIPALIAKARGQDIEDRNLSIKALGDLGRLDLSRVVPVLLEIIEKNELMSRHEAFHALIALAPIPESAIPVLLKQLSQDEFMGANMEAAVVLAKVGKPVVPALINALRSTNEQLRYGAVLSLKYMGADAREANPALNSLLSDPSFLVRAEAAAALAAIR